MGQTVGEIWTAFEANPDVAAIKKGSEAVNYPKYKVSIFSQDWKDWVGLLQPDVAAVELAYELALIEDGANKAADAIVNQLTATYAACTDQTDYLLVGYSQGAWGIDKALRSKKMFSEVEAHIIGILVLGVTPLRQRHTLAM